MHQANCMSLKIEWEGDQGNRVAIGKWRRWPRLQLTAAAALYTNSWRGSFLILDSTHILKNVDDGKSPADVSYQVLCTTSLGWTLFVSLRVNQTKSKRGHGAFRVVNWKNEALSIQAFLKEGLWVIIGKEAISWRICLLVELIMEPSVEISKRPLRVTSRS